MTPEKRPTTALVPLESDRKSVAPVAKSAYWGRVAASYTVIWRVLLIALLLFAVLFMLLFSRAFTYDSLFCFFKDIKTVSAFVPSDYETVYTTYEEGDGTSLSYRGGIAFINRGGIEVYSPDGKRLLAVNREMENPRAVASRKYLVAYDNGSNGFSVTNSYAELFRGETEFPILGATVSDSGHFALITASDKALSEVLLYDNNFNLIQRFQRSCATVGVSVSENGKRIAMLEVGAEQGGAFTRLEIFELGEKNAALSVRFDGEFPLAVGFTSNKNLALLTDGALRCCNIEGKVLASVPTVGVPIAVDINENGVLLVLETDEFSAAHRVIALDKKGDTVCDEIFEGEVRSAALGDGELFLLSRESAVRISTDTGKRTALPTGSEATGLYIVDDGKLRVVYPAKAEFLSFERS